MTDIAAIAPPAVTLADPALQRILRAYAPMCHRLASSHEANAEIARDLAQDILVAVWRAWPSFRQLSIGLREVAILLLEGFTPAEIADTLGLKPNAVSIRGLRAREMLRASLENAMPENCDER